MIDDELICHRCKTRNEFTIEVSGPHYKAVCDNCGRYLKFVSKAFYEGRRRSKKEKFFIHNQKQNTMNGQGYYGSICIEDLFGGKVVKAQNGKSYVCIDDLTAEPFNRSDKNGKHYVNVGLWTNVEANEHGQHASITLSQTKAAREAGEKKVYIGNLKRNGAAPQQAAGGQQQGAAQPQYSKPAFADDLPF